MRRILAPNMPVTWNSGAGRHALILSGRIVTVGKQSAQVLCNGEVYEVPFHRMQRQGLKERRPCPTCGILVKDYRRGFCSVDCFNKYRCQQIDDKVFAAIIRLKTERQGMSPTCQEIGEAVGMWREPTWRSIKRLESAGRIWLEGGENHKQIGVVGGKWVYEGR